MFKYITYCLIVVSLTLFSCEKVPEKPPCDNFKDPDCEGYIKPNARLASFPAQGEIIDTNTITLSWNGNQINSVFSYKITGTSNWSDWSNTKSISYDCISDGGYNFYVKECYPSGDEQANPTTLSFIIDYINGLSIVLVDQCIETTVNSEFEIFILLEEVDSILGAFISISFDPGIINLTERQALLSIISASLTNMVFIATEVQEANIGGLIEINIARFGGEPGNSNSKQIVGLKFRAISAGETQIIINHNSELRDTNNNVIEINKLINATINIL